MMKGLLLGIACVVALGQAVCAAQVQTAWRVDFDDETTLGGMRYVQRAATQTSAGMIAQFGEGTLTFGATQEADEPTWERAVLAWGNGMPWGFWQWPASPFEPIDAGRFPMVELRMRRAPGLDPAVCLTPVFDTDAGPNFTQMNFRLTEEWQTFSFRFSPLTSVPGPRTPRQVVGLVFLVQPPSAEGGSSGFEIDWTRIRSFTPEEKAEDDVIVSRLLSYEPPAWEQPFFIYGPYGGSVLSSWQGGFEAAYGAMVRAHMNYVMCPHDLAYYRFRRPDRSQEESVEAFLAVNRPMVEAAETVGMRLSLDVRGFDAELKEHGLGYILPGIRQVAEAFRNEPAVLGYTPADEPQVADLWEVIGVKQAFEEHDPSKLVAFALADARWTPDFEPYSTVHVGDRYPILDSGRRCEEVAVQMDEYNQATNKPVWMIIQAIGDKPWWTLNKSSYRMPTEAEFLRMAFMALSRGAKGLMIFDWYHTPWLNLVDRCGQPGDLLPVASRLGERLAAVGSILLRCSVHTEPAYLPADPEASGAFEIRELVMQGGAGVLLIAGNTDLEHSRPLDVPLALPLDGRVVLELESLQVSREAKLASGPVAAGDGRLFAVVAPQQAALLRREILSNRREEVARVAQPEAVIRQRWDQHGDQMEELDAQLWLCAADLMALERALLIGDGPAAGTMGTTRPGQEAVWARCVGLGKQYNTCAAAGSPATVTASRRPSPTCCRSWRSWCRSRARVRLRDRR